MANKSIFGHILNIRISVNDVSNCSLLDFFDYFGRVSRLEPEPISVSDTGELLSCNGGSQFSKHGSLHFDFPQHSNVCVDVVNWVITFFNDESVFLVIENFLESSCFFQAESLSQRIVITNTMISISICVDGKEIEVSSHDFRRNIPQFVHIIQSPFLC